MNPLRTPSAVYYRSKVSIEAEEGKRTSTCKDICKDNTSEYVTTCSANDMDIRPHFVGTNESRNAYPHLQGQAIWNEADVKCWNGLPSISLATKPSSFVGELAAQKERENDCYKCLLETQVYMQTKHGVGPDKRFWVGAAAAGTGVLLAVLVGVMRRG